ncbi:hypothetical protein [Kaistia nematophila]|uniref:PepSY domain-containing protein n=1 Tax=Kaistia nematophila TaxID=2994654 RepID=A0A9X3DZH0_9HYPH|nr:hypothetical protein [Kaistia nematophila]MBN9025592.1 hypothetical protein [Hyphomicrobiales bacterium]MCX5568484.1 hypothetical protein [Kaistia nematophila]
MVRKTLYGAAFALLSLSTIQAAVAEPKIDNSALESTDFRPHARTFGLVYTMPAEVNETLHRSLGGMLNERLLTLGLETEAIRTNIPHVTVVHIHNADPTTPAKMLEALPTPPKPLNVTLKKFYTTEAAKGAGQPWWLDLGVVKEGDGFEQMMAYNTAATAALTPLRDGPLPRVTGPVFGKMADAGKELVKTVGVSGVNVVKNGEEVRSHNPHNTLVYSTKPFSPEIQQSMGELADEFNQILPEGIPATFKTVSIVELAFSGNVTREIYRVDLETGAVLDVATGKTVTR